MNGEKTKFKRPVIVAICLLILSGSVAGYYWGKIRPLQLRAEALGCVSRLRFIAFSARMWANDHDGRFPTNFITLFKTPAALVCPREKSNPLRLAKDWSAFDPKNSSYEMVAPGMSEGDEFTVFARCRQHGFTCYGDGTVKDGVERR